jgi:SAM-dependent methyltransferase
MHRRMRPDDLPYAGSELEVFAEARNWKAYWAGEVRPWLRGRVLEVGAGLGTNTSLLARTELEWVALEPDARLRARLAERATGLNRSGIRCQVTAGLIGDLPPAETFDTILYIDVLEHIQDDRAELVSAAQRVRPGGALVVLSPALQVLYSVFDREIGHFRRYTAADLVRLAPPGLELRRVRYLDSLGTLTSLANVCLLKQSTPTRRQIRFWDRSVVPWSRRLDRLLRYTVGRSVMAVWQRPNDLRAG